MLLGTVIAARAVDDGYISARGTKIHSAHGTYISFSSINIKRPKIDILMKIMTNLYFVCFYGDSWYRSK